MKNRILTICPSRGRPVNIDRLFYTLKNTSTLSDIMICIDDDEPFLEQYKHLVDQANLSIQPRMTTTQIINKAFKENPDYDFYHITNDDFVYHTQGWDEKFMQTSDEYGEGIFYGNDTMRDGNLCTAPVISGNIVRAIGWLQQPTLTHLYGDDTWMEIGKKLNILYYHRDVIIEHRHWNNKKAVMDEGYMRVNSSTMFEKDGLAFRNWKEYLLNEDCERIKNGIK